ncbi:MAG: uroporphyrinogen decarboxylase family protein [Oscillospiraceae bacterium]|nr:uroporphyrinogen decarboxylase family protein [Oscillospiraceae bacterium]
MEKINTRAKNLPKGLLVDEIKKANGQKREVLLRRDEKYGANRPKIGSYLENIALPGLFGFDMNDYLCDPELSIEIDLRHKLYWIDNAHDDHLADLNLNSGTMYFDMTLFGLKIKYTYDGVPYFEPHLLERKPDISLLSPFDFEKTGEMPLVHNRFQKMKEISKESYGGEIGVHLPASYRGPLDVAVQLRGYENFIADCAETPDFVHELFSRIIAWRLRYNQERAAFLGADMPKQTMIADDWVNIPFITPSMFDEFMVPAYKKIQDNEGPAANWHTCGIFLPILESLMNALPEMKNLDLGGYNMPDCLEIHKLAPADMHFSLSFVNAFTVLGTPEEHRKVFGKFGKMMADGRRFSLTTSAIEPILGNTDETVIKMNRFIDSAREYFASI